MNTQNPYRYLFPIGGLNAILGAFLWIAFRMQWIEFYPNTMHANLMIGGFLLSFAFGFLWTAIPRFFRAPMPTQSELIGLVLCMGATPLLGSLTQPAFFYLAVLGGLLLTIRFGIRRFKLRRNAPPPSFIFVFSAMAINALCLATLALSSVVDIPADVIAFARTVFLKGFAIFLVMGIGMKLVPALTGWNPPPDSETGEIDYHLNPAHLFLIAILLIGLWSESNGHPALAGPLYSSALIYAGLSEMKLGRIPKVRSGLSFPVWISMIVMSVAPLLFVLDPSYAIHFWHLIFIGGFGLLTIFVSLRVVMAHSGQKFLRWEKRPAYFLIAGLILFAAATRMASPYVPESMVSHYAYAAGAWIAALVGWAIFFVRFTPGFWRNKPSSAEADNC